MFLANFTTNNEELLSSWKTLETFVYFLTKLFPDWIDGKLPDFFVSFLLLSSGCMKAAFQYVKHIRMQEQDQTEKV